MKHLHNQVEDIYSHSCSIANWQQVYYQITPGKLSCILDFLQLDSAQLYKEQFNKGTAQYGAVPADLLSIAMINRCSKNCSTVQGLPFESGSLYVVGPGKEFMTHTEEGIETIVISLPLDRVQNICETVFPHFSPSKNLLNSISVHKILEPNLFFSAISAIFENIRGTHDGEHKMDAPETALIDALLCTIIGNAEPPPQFLSERVRADIVRRSKELIHEREAVNILTICQRLRVSRRTLQMAFNYVTGNSPLAYLRSVKLGHVRQQIMQNSNSSVGDIAFENGFFHLGRFSGDYKHLFGELPSETRNACLKNRLADVSAGVRHPSL